MLVAIPSGVKMWNWLATMYRGSIVLQTPMCYALCFLFLFAIGGLTGLFLATLATNFNVHDTYFVVGHFHYVMIGARLSMFFGGVHYWWPKITGRMYNETMGRLNCLLFFVGFNFTFFPQLVMGTHGMPRRYATYLPEFQPYHVLSSIGAMTQGLSILLMLAMFLHSLYRGRPCRRIPGAARRWNGPARRRRRTTILPAPRTSANRTTTRALCGTKRPKDI